MRIRFLMSVWAAALVVSCFSSSAASAATNNLSSNTSLAGEQKQWHKLTFTFTGPASSESATPNPFRNYRLNVVFKHAATNRTLIVPGFFAADGFAEETSATAGDKWQVHFAPDETGTWTYVASFRTGPDVAISLSPTAGTATSFDGASGSFTVDPTDKTGVDFRGKGRLQEVGENYLQFLGSKEYFIKTGSGSPETFLAYADFDNTVGGLSILHHYANHVKDFRAGDPTWKNGHGKGIIGGLNYLSSKGANSLYFLVNSLHGQAQNVWPYATTTDTTRFDVSKLAQWEIVFEHMDHLGILLHMFTQERSNDHMLDSGTLGLNRKLYYRELVARFSHHLGLIWNIGEENTNTTSEQIQFSDYINALDPYAHLIAVHTYPSERDKVYTPLLGNPVLHGAALQVDPSIAHSETLKWLNKSTAAGSKWTVSVDEQGSADVGALPDSNDASHTALTRQVLWGCFFAGGSGVEWYFGYSYPNNDLNCEDWSTRSHLWTLSKYAADFVRNYLPLPLVANCDGLTSATDDYCIGKAGVAYASYLPNGQTTMITLPANETYTVDWYNPRTGGALQKGTVTSVSGGTVAVGFPPAEKSLDWVVLLRRSGSVVGGLPPPSPPPPPSPTGSPSISGLNLVNTTTQQNLRLLVDGSTISLSKDGSALNVSAQTSGSIGSVGFVVNGATFRIENLAPYAMAGDQSGVYSAWTPVPGNYTLSVTPYSGANRSGTVGSTMSLSFTVVN
jgi:hypothetical protein